MNIVLISYIPNSSNYDYNDRRYYNLNDSVFEIKLFKNEEDLIKHLYEKLYDNDKEQFNGIFLNWTNLVEVADYWSSTYEGIESIQVCGNHDQYWNNEDLHTDDYVDNIKERIDLEERVRNAVQEKIDESNEEVWKVQKEAKEKQAKEKLERELKTKLETYAKLKKELEDLDKLQLVEENK